jgi:hypothetical protein
LAQVRWPGVLGISQPTLNRLEPGFLPPVGKFRVLALLVLFSAALY